MPQQQILPPLSPDAGDRTEIDDDIDPDGLPPDLAFTPVEQRSKRWTGIRDQKQRIFIAHLAATGAVTMAAKAAGHSASAFYQLRKRPGADSFAAAWDRAVEMGARRVADLLMEYAIYGVPETLSKEGRVILERRRPHIRAMQLIVASNFPERFGGINPVDSPDAAIPHAIRRLREKWRAEWEAERQARQREHDERANRQDTELDNRLRVIRTAYQRRISHDPVKRAAWDLLTGPGTDWDAVRRADAYTHPQKHEWHMFHPDMIVPIAAGAGRIDWDAEEGGDLSHPNPPRAADADGTDGGEEDELWFERYKAHEIEGEAAQADRAAARVTRGGLRAVAHGLRERAEAWQQARAPVIRHPHGFLSGGHLASGSTLRERDAARRRVERDIVQLEREWNAAYSEESWAAWKAADGHPAVSATPVADAGDAR